MNCNARSWPRERKAHRVGIEWQIFPVEFRQVLNEHPYVRRLFRLPGTLVVTEVDEASGTITVKEHR